MVYLADNVYLTDQQIKNIRDYVYNGGGLIVSYATSLYDRNKERRATFALQDLIRVRPVPLPETLKSYHAMIGGPNDLYYLKRNDSGVPGPRWDNQLIPLWYYEPVEVLDGGRVIMDIVTGDGRRPSLPGIVMSETGKGKVIYSCSSLESLYYSNGNIMLRDLIKSLISAVSQSQAPYTVDAPAGLITNLTCSGNTYLLQMTNWTGNKFEKTHVIEDYISQGKNVSIRFQIPSGKTVEEVKSLTGSGISFNIMKDIIEIKVPEAGAYEGIEIRLR